MVNRAKVKIKPPLNSRKKIKQKGNGYKLAKLSIKRGTKIKVV